MNPTQEMEARDDVVRVMRPDGRGLHWVWRRDIEEPDATDQQAPDAAQTPDKPRRGRPPKHQPIGAAHGDR